MAQSPQSASRETAADRRVKTRPAERRNRDDAVIAAAVQVMSERGYAATTIQEVADRVGVLKGSLYHYFASKEELLFRILDESHTEATMIADQVSALGLSPFEELLEYLRRSTLWYLSNVDRANIWFAEARNLTGERLKQTQLHGREFEQHVRQLLTAAQELKQITVGLDVRLLTRYVLGSLNEVRAWPSRSGKQFSAAEMADAFVLLTRNALTAS